MIRVGLLPEHQRTIDRLGELSGTLQKKVVGSGLTAAAKPVKEAMRLLSPVGKTGRLRDAIGQNRVSARASDRLDLFDTEDLEESGALAVLIGPNRRVGGRRRASLANLLEHGTKPHRIKPRSARGILKLRGGLFARSVLHPGIKATRYMERALEQAGSQIEERFFEGMSKRLDRLS